MGPQTSSEIWTLENGIELAMALTSNKYSWGKSRKTTKAWLNEAE